MAMREASGMGLDRRKFFPKPPRYESYADYNDAPMAAIAEVTMRCILAEREEPGHPPVHPATHLPHFLAEWSSSTSISCIAPGSPNPVDDITVM